MNCPNCKSKLVEMFLTVACDWCDYGLASRPGQLRYACYAIVDTSHDQTVGGPLYLFISEAAADKERYEAYGFGTLAVVPAITFFNPVLTLEITKSVEPYKIYRNHKCPIDEPFVAWQTKI